jgi:electron transfer flavoprotein beta subunit
VKIIVCAKEVLDPDAVNNYALEGKLEIGEDGKSMTQAGIPRLMNAYDEQAIEGALQLRDAGLDVELIVVCAGKEPTDILKHAAALNADDVVHLDTGTDDLDCHAAARLLAAFIESRGGADIVLCGRQASDDDQGVVPSLIGEALGMPVVAIARSLEADGSTLKIARVTPDGDENVEVDCPAVVTISNEIGEPRYPTMKDRMAARKKKITVVAPSEIGVDDAGLAAKVRLTKQFVPEVNGDCEFIEVGSAAEAAAALVSKLRADNAL